MKRAALSSCGLLLMLPVLFIAAAVGVLDGGSGVSLGQPAADVEQIAGIPAEYLQLFQAAGVRYGVPWTVLAGIGKVECDDGQDPDPSCTHEGAVNYAGAGGPMQFLASHLGDIRRQRHRARAPRPLERGRRDIQRREVPEGQRRSKGTPACDLRVQPLPGNTSKRSCAGRPPMNSRPRQSQEHRAAGPAWPAQRSRSH